MYKAVEDDQHHFGPNLHHPVGNVDLSLVGNKLKNSTVSGTRGLLVGEFEQHWVNDVQPERKTL